MIDPEMFLDPDADRRSRITRWLAATCIVCALLAVLAVMVYLGASMVLSSMALGQELALAPPKYFRHPPPGTLDPYSGLGCCHRVHCRPVPFDWTTGMIQLEPDGEWVDPASLNPEKLIDASRLPGDYASHVSVCRTPTRTLCLIMGDQS